MLEAIWYWLIEYPKEAAAEKANPSPPRFYRGDLVAMYGRNPYKGTLRAGAIYRVHEIGKWYNENIVYLKADNKSLGKFYTRFFHHAVHVTPSHISIIGGKNRSRKGLRGNRRAHLKIINAEYDEIMQAQELLENATK